MCAVPPEATAVKSIAVPAKAFALDVASFILLEVPDLIK